MEDFSHSVVNSNSGQMLEAKFQFHIHLMSNLYDLNSVLGTDSGIKKKELDRVLDSESLSFKST